MNADQLLEHFERISDAADAVPRLRRFVLELAVQGRLTRPKDDSAPHCLTAKACSFPDADVWQIPTHWAFVELQQLAGSSGLLIDGDWVESKDQDPAGAIRLTQLADVGVGAFRDRSARFMNEETASRLGCTFLAPGDVLIARMPDPLGRACIFPGDKRPCVTVVDVAILRPNRDDIDPAFVVHAINSPVFAKNVAAKAAGTTRSRISRGNLAKLPFPLPPLAEQHSIVAKVDELMALCDRLEAAQSEREARRDRLVSASLARVTEPHSDDATSMAPSARFHLDHFGRLTTRPEHVKQLRQTILNLAVRGRLVPQDLGDEHALEALIRHGLRTTQEQQPVDLPPGWGCVHFEDVAVVSGGVTLGRKLGSRKTVSLPYLRVANVKRGHFDLAVVKEVEVAVDEVEKYSLRRDDLLMTEGGDWDKVGRAAIWQEQVPVCLHQNHVFRARMRSPEISPRWCEMYFNSPTGRSYFEDASKQTTNLASINMRQVRGCPVPLPPLAEQRRIVAKVDELMALCDQLEASLASAATDRARLLEALLHEALEPAA